MTSSGAVPGAARLYPALEITWPSSPSDLDRELLLAMIDDDAPTAVEEVPRGSRVFFTSAAARDRAAVRIRSALPVVCDALEVSDERWAERSQSALTPVRVGGLVVMPEPEVIRGLADAEGESRSHTRVLVIRPSMGFGTGHHASTRLCLQLMQQVPVAGARVLDVGTGSGILAIAAALLGAARVRAIDNDADAIRSARENLDLNGLAHTIALAHCDLTDLPAEPPAELVTANLTATHLISSAARLGVLAAPHGRLILGGLQTGEENDVRQALAEFGWAAASRAEEDGWVGLILERDS